MDIVIKLMLILLFLLITSWSGYYSLKKLNISFSDNITTAIAGLFFIESLNFSFFLGVSLVTDVPFIISYLPGAILVIYHFYQNRSNLLKPIKSIEFIKNILPVTILSLSVLGFYFFEGWSQIQSVLSNNGVIYQDVIYHAGISNSLSELGYPIKDLQYEGSVISYHIFTHFAAAQMAVISSIEVSKIYILFFTNISIVLISFLIYSISRSVLKIQFRNRDFLLVGGVTFFGAYFMGLGLSTAYFPSIYFSYSYQWQLIIFLLVANYIIKNTKYDTVIFSNKDYLVLIFSTCLAIVTKGSSLPLLLAGLGFMFLTKTYQHRKINIKDIGFLGLTTFLAVLIYLVFFSSEDGADFLSFIEFNDSLLKKTLFFVIMSKIEIENTALAFSGLLFAILSFRYYLFFLIKHPIVSFAIGIFITGTFFFLLYSNNPIYFLIPCFFISNLVLSLYIVKNKNKIANFYKITIAFLFLLSVYPISSLGFGFKKKLAEKEATYLPLNEKRLSLYNWMNTYTHKESLFFTPSVYATDKFIGDNYYPPALSKRVFYLGGFRFGNPRYFSSFKERLALVDNFSLTRREHYQQLIDANVDFVLIEKKGNRNKYDSNLFSIKEKASLTYYEFVISNEAGVILKLNKEE